MSVNQASNHQHISQLYHQYNGWLRHWLRQRVGCSELSADLAQDTFIRLLKRPEQLAGINSEKGYLRTIANSLCIDMWRRKSIEQAWLEALTARPQHIEPSPEDQTLVIEALAEIEKMLSELPNNVATAFIWSQIDGLTYREIALQLAVSERMVKKYMARAMLACVLVEARFNDAELVISQPNKVTSDVASPLLLTS